LLLTTTNFSESIRKEAMRSVALITLLTFFAQAHAEQASANEIHAEENAVNGINDNEVDMVLSKLTDKLVDRAQLASSHDSADLDDSTLGKPGHVEEMIVIPSEGKALIFEDDNDDEDSMLPLELRGGAAMKAMKAMKSPMKAMKSMKAMKAMAKKAPAKKAMTSLLMPLRGGGKSMKAMKAPSVKTTTAMKAMKAMKGMKKR
jgi:hypothetical protein